MFFPYARRNADVVPVTFRRGGGYHRVIRTDPSARRFVWLLDQRVFVRRSGIVARVGGNLSKILFFGYDPACVVSLALESAGGLPSTETWPPTRVGFFRIHGRASIRSTRFLVVNAAGGRDHTYYPGGKGSLVVLTFVLLGRSRCASTAGKVAVFVRGTAYHPNVFGVVFLPPTPCFQLTNDGFQVGVGVHGRQFRPVFHCFGVQVWGGGVINFRLLRDRIMSIYGAVILVR